jgi:hypothetical protein
MKYPRHRREPTLAAVEPPCHNAGQVCPLQMVPPLLTWIITAQSTAPTPAPMVAATEKPVQWMTLQELRYERDRTGPAWETTELDGVLADGHLPVFSQDAHRHQVVANELPRRPGGG